MSLVSRLRFAIRRKLNIYRGNHKYRAIYCREGGSIRAVMRYRDGPEREFFLRAGTSDLTVFRDVFDRLQYSTHIFSRDRDLSTRYDAILRQGRRPLIIDAGGNIGCTALYYRDAYPEAAIVSIEPEGRNFAELRRHSGDDPLMLPLQAALCGMDGESEISNPEAQAWSFRTRILSSDSANSGVKIPALSVDTVVGMAAARWPIEPFLFKIDIEGGEDDLFRGKHSWIDSFYVIVLELHDWMLSRRACSKTFLAAVAGRDRDFILKGENVFSISNTDPSIVRSERYP